MIPVRRVEIVVASPHAKRVIALLEERGFEGWTRIRGVSGSGERGHQRGDEPTGASSNDWILAACEPEVFDGAREELRSLLSSLGGMCLVSEAMWLRH